jgi:hypothetical protein
MVLHSFERIGVACLFYQKLSLRRDEVRRRVVEGGGSANIRYYNELKRDDTTSGLFSPSLDTLCLDATSGEYVPFGLRHSHPLSAVSYVYAPS